MENTHRTQQLQAMHRELIRATQAWALRQRVDPGQLRELCRQAILANHTYYLKNILVYRRFAQEEGIGDLDDIEPIKHRLMFPDDLFKSYESAERRFRTISNRSLFSPPWTP